MSHPQNPHPYFSQEHINWEADYAQQQAWKESLNTLGQSGAQTPGPGELGHSRSNNGTWFGYLLLMAGALALAAKAGFVVSTSDVTHMAVAAIVPVLGVGVLWFIAGRTERALAIAMLVAFAVEVLLWHPWTG